MNMILVYIVCTNNMIHIQQYTVNNEMRVKYKLL